MGSGIKLSVLLFSFALISAISIDDLPEKKNVYIKPDTVIDDKSLEYKLDDLNKYLYNTFRKYLVVDVK